MADLKIKKHGSVRSYQLKRRYGLTEEDVAALLVHQGNLCLICLQRRPLHVDHGHASGDYRGLLRFRCNGGLGQFRDDARVMRRAVDYLEGRLVEPYRRRIGAIGTATRDQRRRRRHYRLIERYRIGTDEVEHLVEGQGGICPICRKAFPTAVDHDHVTGAVRGILCADCNTGMGQLRDDPWVLRRAIEYLTGGLSGLRPTGDGGYEVAVVRPRRPGDRIDPGWELGQACTDDLALLHSLARGDSGDPWESDTGVAGTEPSELRFPALDLSEPLVDEPAPAEPPEYAFS
jgi:hypothetical protein